MEGKVALVTGGAEGIGRALVEKFLQERAKGVAVLDFNKEKGEDTVKCLKDEYGDGKVVFIHCDVTSESDMKGAFAEVKKTFGCLHVVCNNAGITDELNWDKMVDTNLKGVIRGTYLAVEYMGTKHGGEGGIVVNTASIFGYDVTPYVPIYGACKHGVVALTRNTAGEPMFVDNKVRVAAICPGRVLTSLQDKITFRYQDKFPEVRSQLGEVPISFVADTAMKLVREPDKMNGVVCAVLPDDPMKIITLADNQ